MMLSWLHPHSPALNVEGRREGGQLPRVNIQGMTSAAQQQVQYGLRILQQRSKAACRTGLPPDRGRLRQARSDLALPLPTDKQSASVRAGARSAAHAPTRQALPLSRPESDAEQRYLVVERNKDGKCHGIHTSGCVSNRLLRGHVARFTDRAFPMRRFKFQI